jgi:hypothetical protein
MHSSLAPGRRGLFFFVVARATGMSTFSISGDCLFSRCSMLAIEAFLAGGDDDVQIKPNKSFAR